VQSGHNSNSEMMTNKDASIVAVLQCFNQCSVLANNCI